MLVGPWPRATYCKAKGKTTSPRPETNMTAIQLPKHYRLLKINKGNQIHLIAMEIIHRNIQNSETMRIPILHK